MPSTAISRINYHPSTRRLFVTFVGSGKTYMYFDVPNDEYQSFIASSSRGKYFNDRIRDHYRNIELESREVGTTARQRRTANSAGLTRTA
ncbi:MAG: KTSC domain-containing protein [Rhodospirillaceae bacterium]|nr:KTSC domain-containing protein [Rhodospirillaceae bacterium]